MLPLNTTNAGYVVAALPVGKGIAMTLMFGSALIASLIGLFASKDKLAAMSGVIGTDKPAVARAVCGIGTVMCAGGTLMSILGLVGAFD